MKKIIILSAGEFQIPVIEEAKKMGLYVYVLDINPNSIGIPYADEYVQCSLKDELAVLEIAKRIQPDAITPGASDVGVFTAAYVCERLGLPSISITSAVASTNKYAMIDAFKKHGVPCPDYQYIKNNEINSFTLKLNFPIISKPVDMFGSRGISLSYNYDDLLKTLNETSKIGYNGDIILEEFMEGPEVSVELAIKNYIPYVLQVTDKLTTGSPHFIEYGHTQPSRLPENVLKEIKRVATEAAKAVGIKNGVGHAEIIITNKGPKMVEIGARMGSDSIQEQLIMLSTGINVANYLIKVALGEEVDIPKPIFNKGSAIRFLLSKKGKIVNLDLNNLENFSFVKFAKLYHKNGDIVEDAKDNSGRLAYVITQGENAKEAAEYADDAVKKIIVDIEKR